MKKVRLIVAPDELTLTLEQLLTTRGDLTPEVFRGALAAGGVTINRKRQAKADAPLKLRDEIVAHLESRGAAARGPQPLEKTRVLKIDRSLLAIDKPPFVAAQGTALDAAAGLDAAVRALLLSMGQRDPFVGLVHRLDLETTGVTLFGRTNDAVTALSAQFREGTVEKTYVLLVAGTCAFEEVDVDQPIAADEAQQGRYVVSPRGRASRTIFRVVERIGGRGIALTKLEATPKSGRTHQIRVHAAHLGHPLVGDKRYGGPAFVTNDAGERLEAPRVALHAARLRCGHPDGSRVDISAPWPADLAGFEARARSLAAPAAARRRPGGP